MRPPFSYYGGKIGLAPTIAALLPPHRVYLEPFFGSGAVLFAKPAAPHEIVNDVNEALVTFWRVLRSRRDELEHVCALTPYSRDEYNAAAHMRHGPDGCGLDELEVARRWWVRVNQSFAKTAGTRTGWASSTGRNASVAATMLNRLGRFAPAAARLANVAIENCDAIEMISRYASAADTVVYADPPYLGDTRRGRSQRCRAGDYQHEMMDEESHRRLAEVLTSTRAHIVVSGYDSPLYEECYGGWHRVEHVVVGHSSNARRAGTRSSRTEVLWCNFPPPVRQLELF